MTDSNLVGTSFAGTNTKDLKLQLYIESDDGTKIEGIGGENTKVKEIHLPVYKASEKQAEYEDGYVYVNSGNVYDFTLNELQNYESYLKQVQVTRERLPCMRKFHASTFTTARKKKRNPLHR